jgi:hypothetical protein
MASWKKSVHLPQGNYHAYAWKNRIFFGILVAVVMAMICGPALALPSPSPVRGAGQFNLGIPVYWPYHVMLVSTGLILLVAGFIIARFRKTGTWYETHIILEIVGSACAIAGLFIGIYMVTLSGLPHFRNIHEIVGGVIGILLIITITLGYFIKRANKSKKIVRISHRWLGRISIALLVINVGLGILFLSIILQR